MSWIKNITYGNRVKANMALVFLVFSWSSSMVAGKYAFTHYPLAPAVFLRMLLASFAFFLLRSQWRDVRLRPGDWKWFLAMGLCDPCLFLTFEARALVLTSASQAGVISATSPLLTLGCAVLFLGEKTSRAMLFGFFLAFLGVAGLSAASPGDDLLAPNPLLGNTLEFIAIFWGALFVVCAKKLSGSYPPIFLALVTTLCGLVYFLPPALWSWSESPPVFHGGALLAIAYLALAVTIAGMFCMNYSLREFPAGRVAAALNLVPVLTIILGRLCLGEEMTWLQYGLSLIVLWGLLVIQRHSG